jgi:hypothetical protein
MVWPSPAFRGRARQLEVDRRISGFSFWMMRHPVWWGLSYGLLLFAVLTIVDVFEANIFGARFSVVVILSVGLGLAQGLAARRRRQEREAAETLPDLVGPVRARGRQSGR